MMPSAEISGAVRKEREDWAVRALAVASPIHTQRIAPSDSPQPASPARGPPVCPDAAGACKDQLIHRRAVFSRLGDHIVDPPVLHSPAG